MGNFYTNIVLRESDIQRVASALEGLRRRAYVAAAGHVSVVYDERCDDQDLDELQKLAGKLSEKLGGPALAFCNHDDDVLWYALAEGGRVVDTYDSCPGYFDGGSTTPKGGDAGRLCATFDASDNRSDVDALLRADRKSVMFEVERHQKLLDLLRLPTLALLGYRYVSQGELEDIAGEGVQLRAVGGAPASSAKRASPPATTARSVSAVPEIDGKTLAAMQAEAKAMLSHVAALAFAEVDVPERMAGAVPAGRTNAYTVMARLQRYIITAKLGATVGVVRPDEALARLVGTEEFPFVALARKVREALSVPPLSDADDAALRAGDAEFHLRFHTALRAAAEAALDG